MVLTYTSAMRLLVSIACGVACGIAMIFVAGIIISVALAVYSRSHYPSADGTYFVVAHGSFYLRSLFLIGFTGGCFYMWRRQKT
jgi:heme/copper-type cytochrome/quinol oxidase subunit 1